MNEGVKTVIFPVKDLDGAKALFTALLGAAPESDTPYYVGWKVAGQDVGLDPNGHAQGLTGPVAYFHVDDIAGSVQALHHDSGFQPVNWAESKMPNGSSAVKHVLSAPLSSVSS